MGKSQVSIEWQEWNKEPDVAALEQAATSRTFTEAEMAFKQLIEQGSILSMVNLGNQYEFRPENDGGPDFIQAEFWYRKAIYSGSAAATLPVGYFYLRRKDYEKAREVFLIGMDRNYAPSITRLGNMYIKGWGVDRDYVMAKELFERASKLGNLWAKRAVAAMTFNLSENVLGKLMGLLMIVIYYFEFKFQMWRDPRSERLKK